MTDKTKLKFQEWRRGVMVLIMEGGLVPRDLGPRERGGHHSFNPALPANNGRKRSRHIDGAMTNTNQAVIGRLELRKAWLHKFEPEQFVKDFYETP